MARLVLGAVGAIIGGIYGGPTGAALGWSIGSAIGAVAFPPPGQDISGPRLSDLRVQNSAYGQAIPRIYGSMRVAGNVIWSTNLIEHSNTEDSGSKGGGGGDSYTSYTYSANFAVMLCEGEVCVRKLWANGKLIYDSTATPSGASPDIRIYSGSETQMPDPLIESVVGVGMTPAYRGTCYVVFENLQLANYSNAIPSIAAEVVAVNAGCAAQLIHEDTTFEGSDSLCYVESLDEIWQCESGASGRIARYNTSGTLQGYVGTGSDLFQPIIYDPTDDLVWGWRTNTLVKYDCATLVQTEYTVSGLQGIKTMFNGELWTNHTTSLKQIDKTTGGVIETRTTTKSVFDWTLDGSDNIWYTNYTVGNKTKLGKITNTGTETFTTPAIPDSYDLSFIAYDNARTVLWVGSGANTGHLSRIQLDGTTIDTTLNVSPSGPSAAGWLTIDTANDLLPIVNNTASAQTITVIDLTDASTVCTLAINVNIAFAVPITTGGVTWVQYGTGLDLYKSASGASCDLIDVPNADIITAECGLVGLTPADLDVTDIDSSVRGYMIGRRMSVRSGLEPLAGAFSFDVTETDWELKFVERGAASVRTLTAADLAWHEDGSSEPPAEVAGTRMHDLDLPARVDISYLRRESDYQVSTAFARRETASGEQNVSMEWAMVLSDDQATHAAQTQMLQSWLARQQGKIQCHYKHADLEPCDNITVPFGGENRVVSIGKKSESRNGLLQFEVVMTDQSTFTGFGTGDGGADTAQSGIEIIADTNSVLMDLPCLRDQDDGFGPYWAAGPADATQSWNGAALYKSYDGGLSYSLIHTVNTPATIGTASGALGAGRSDIVDTASSVTVVLTSGSLSSISRTAFFNGGNACAIKSGSGWEVGQFMTATLTAPNTYKLTNWLRGRKGTEDMMAGHANGDIFVLLTGGGVTKVDQNIADFNVSRTFKAVTLGQLLADVSPFTFTNSGRILKPYSGVQLGGGRNAAGDITIKWKRRTRIGGEWIDAVDVQLGEASELYDVEIWDSTFSTLKRTYFNVTSQSQIYDSASQGSDWGSNQSIIYVRIYQLSSSIGRGYPLSGSI